MNETMSRCQGQMLLTPARQTFLSECIIQTSDKRLPVYLRFVSRMVLVLKGFGYMGSVLKIIHLGTQVGETSA